MSTGQVAAYADRPFLVSTPAHGGRGRPLVVALHGSGVGPEQMEATTQLAARGSAAGVNVVLPSAADRLWNNFSLNDEPYLDAVIEAVLRRTCADLHALVLTGFSNGGDEAQTIGCVEASRWRAVVVVSSSTVPDRCVPGGPPVTLLRVHGLLDRTSPFEGRTGDDPRDPVLPATARWAAYDGCPGPPERTQRPRCRASRRVGPLPEMSALGIEDASRPGRPARRRNGLGRPFRRFPARLRGW